jgi:hypothetical protein
MSTDKLSYDETNMFIEVFKLGGRLNASDEVLSILRLLRRLQPNTTGLAVVQAWQMMQTGKMKESRRLLETLDRESPGLASVKATLAAVLYFSSDSLWQSYAAEVRKLPPDEDALAMVDAVQSASDSQVDPIIARQLLGMAGRRAPAESAAA